jgi:hypothetical protein
MSLKNLMMSEKQNSNVIEEGLAVIKYKKDNY